MPTLPAPYAETLRYSPFLARLLESRPWLTERLAATLDLPIDREAMQTFLADPPGPLPFDPDERLEAALRRLRTRVLAHVALRDLAGRADLDEVTGTMTTLAEVALEAAHDHAFERLIERHGRPLSPSGWEQELLVVGMGKLGGRELNVSSDIDLVFLYPEDGDTAGPKILSNFEFFERLGRRIIHLLGAPTADGFVFRVDMRLRPHGDSGPLVCSFDMLEDYLLTQGREWERYAWIKGRVLRGERWQELESLVRPFVFRKYLDYGAIEAMRALHAQIRHEVMRQDRLDDVKLGPGGIREIEFIAQVHQLIRGGRDPALQIRPTRQVLRRLAERDILPAETAAALDEAYVFLRRVEHRLQYWEDAQTHRLPRDDTQRLLLAQAMGHPDWPSFERELRRHRERVAAESTHVFGQEARSTTVAVPVLSAAVDELEHCLQERGFARPQELARRIDAFRTSPRTRALTAADRNRLDALLPRAIDIAATHPKRDEVLERLLELFEAIGRRSAYLSLLQEYPQALRRVAELVGAARQAATYLTRHPILLDEILDERHLDEEPDWPAFAHELERLLDALEPDAERQMDLMREHHHAQAFRLLMRDLAGRLTVERLSDHLSALADTLLNLTLRYVWRKLRRRHTDTPRFAVIAYGKLGSKELGYVSDLDLVYLFDDPHPDALETYTRYAQRINTWLSTRTAAGILYEVDLRLRPDGEAGLPVTPLEGFHRYQREKAWTWEHQALTRARFCAGNPELGARFEAIRREILCLPRDPAKLREEVLAMRQKMRDAHPSRPGLFHLKHDPGGLIDVEFLVQYLVLAHAHEHPELTANTGNIALLRCAADLGLIDATLARQVADAYRELRRLQHRQRLDELPAVVPEGEAAALREPVLALWRQIFT